MAEGGKSRPTTAASHVSHATSHHTSATERSAHTTSHSGCGATTPVSSQGRGGDPFARYHLLFTGPDGLRPQRVAVQNGQFVGDTSPATNEHTCNLSYLFSVPKDTPFPKAKNGSIGETGWEMEHFIMKK